MSDYGIEHVLILQGGGSLGAFGCGVFKALANNNIKIDIVAGTSIGAVNAAIIAGSKGDHPEKELEQFWLELADGDTRLNSPFVDWFAKYPNPVPTRISQTKSTLSFYRSAFNGNEKVFVPRWSPGHFFSDQQYLTPAKWTYLFDHSPLVKTMEKYVDFNKLQPNSHDTRLIITAVNVLTAEPLIFDSAKQQITPKHHGRGDRSGHNDSSG